MKISYSSRKGDDGIIFRLGDMVETAKGARFRGEIIAFDMDDDLPGCTVRAIDPGFLGCKHVYPLKQLRHITSPILDHFGLLVERARADARKASQKFPQPNYTTLKIAEEAGEVVRAAVHYAEKRMEWTEVEGEIVQLLAMLIRFVTEGDQVNGIVPPHLARPTLVSGIMARCEHGIIDFEQCPHCRSGRHV